MICDKCIAAKMTMGSITWKDKIDIQFDHIIQFTSTYCNMLEEKITNDVWECTLFKEKK